MLTYLIVFIISMFPLVELRGAIPYGLTMGMSLTPTYIIAIIGNMLPVPFIYFFARKILEWGAEKPGIGGFFFLVPDEGREGRTEAAGEGGTRSVCSTIAVRGNSAAGNRRMDRNIGRQSSGYGF